MKRILHFIFIWLLLVSCQNKEENTKGVYFAGEIVNPTDRQVVLFKGEKAIDSIELDENNRFEFSLDSVQEGLHHFYHHPELQYVYLENGDSLQARLNTVDFDESLVFSGKGEEINNLLLEIFLDTELEEDLVYSFYELEPAVFSLKIDSLKNEKLNLLDNSMNEFSFSYKAYEIVKAGIVYNSNISKEAYPFYHRRRSGENKMHELPDFFYQYRQDVDYNNQELTYLRPYYNFMKFHLGNLAYTSCKDNCGDNLKVASKKLHFNKHQLKLIDSLISENELRDNLFRNVAIDYLLKHDSEENTRMFIEDFHKLSKNNKHNSEINNLYEGIISMQPTKALPALTLYNYDGDEIVLSEVSSGEKVVFYFWSSAELGHFKNIIKQVAKLKEKHPNYNYVGISLRTDEKRWRGLVETYDLDKNEQLWINDYDKAASALVVYDPNKSIIAKDGIIIDAFANIYKSFK
jgi:hypothetical protein